MLRQIFPRYACFVAKPTEASRQFVADVSQLTRQLDDDPYTDVIWGILTGYDASNALRIALEKEPLVVKRVAGGTEVALDKCNEGIWYSELKAGLIVHKNAGSLPAPEKGPKDTTRLLAEELVNHPPTFLSPPGTPQNATGKSASGTKMAFSNRRPASSTVSTRPESNFPLPLTNPASTWQSAIVSWDTSTALTRWRWPG